MNFNYNKFTSLARKILISAFIVTIETEYKIILMQ